MKRVVLMVLICVGIILPISSFSQEAKIYFLKGLELAKGQDVGDIRYGTKFAGEVLDSENSEVIGFWNVSLNYRGAEWVEVCGGSNDVISMRLMVVLDDDNLSGMAVFKMRDNEGNPDVFWDFREQLCGLGGLDCPYPWEDPDPLCPDDNDPSYGPVASIGGGELGIQLYPAWRTGCFRRPKRVQQGYIKGWLRHNYPLVPRIDGTLTLIY